MQVKIIYLEKNPEFLEFENWELVYQYLIKNKGLCAFSVENTQIKSPEKKYKKTRIIKKVQKNEFIFSGF